MSPDLVETIVQAKQYLLSQAEGHFAETRHTMVFPRRAGFSVRTEEQSTDVFARSVLASVLLDTADLNDEDVQFRAALSGIARREAEYVAQAKLKDRAGGWSYFPNLPELPPDIDSLAAALLLFARIAPEYTSLCEGPIELALDNVRQDGSLETWLIAPTDDAARRKLMEKGITRYWGSGADVGVCARFYLALLAYDRRRYGEVAHKGARYILGQQQPSGAWEATWYWGRVYGTGLCLRLLQKLGVGEEARFRAVAFLLSAQREDGGWGVWETVPLDTALAVWALASADSVERSAAIRRAVPCLLDYYTGDGYWNPSPWIKMEVGRAQGRVTHALTYQSTILTTAFCLRSLLLARRLSLQRI